MVCKGYSQPILSRFLWDETGVPEENPRRSVWRGQTIFTYISALCPERGLKGDGRLP